jgi:1,4-alpha-glucan branching enzyme
VDPLFRRHRHHELIFRSVYAFNERFVLPLSHDEVVYGKGSLLHKMPGDDWQKFANLRLLLSYMYVQPGKKLLFMGSEIAQWSEWQHDSSLEWHLLAYDRHRAIRLLVGDLNRLYRMNQALHAGEFSPETFEWIEADDAANNVLVFSRRGAGQVVVTVANFSPVFRPGYRIGVPVRGAWREIYNSDAKVYGGSGRGNFGRVQAVNLPLHGRKQSLTLDLPPLAALILEPYKQNPTP